MAAKVDWFSRGRDAFTEGRPCLIQDARISGKDRSAWYAGWNHQARLNTAKNIPAEARAEAVDGITEILNTLRSTP